MAFARTSTGTYGGWDVWVQAPEEGAEPRQLTFASYDLICDGLAWAPDGAEVFFTTVDGDFGIHRVRLTGGDPVPVLGVGAGYPSLRGNRMVHQQITLQPIVIWRGPGRRASAAERSPRPLITSTQGESQPAYSPEGDRIAFVSRRSGVAAIWVSRSDGSDPVQLTRFDAHSGSPSWSPDGRRIAFDSVVAGDWSIYVVDAEGGTPRRVTPEDSDESIASWSRDGRSIYFSSNRTGSAQVWRIPADGGEAVQVTRSGGTTSRESWDGRWLYFSPTQTKAAVWKVPVAGGEETEVVQSALWSNRDWAVVQDGLYYATIGPERQATVEFLDVGSGRVSEVCQTEDYGFSLAVSPDEKWILYGQFRGGKDSSELMLVENFS